MSPCLSSYNLLNSCPMDIIFIGKSVLRDVARSISGSDFMDDSFCQFGLRSFFSTAQPSFFHRISDIIRIGSWKQVFWIATGRVIAFMTNVKMWQVSVCEKVRHSMCCLMPSLYTKPQISISPSISKSGPGPTLVWSTDCHSTPKPLLGIAVTFTHDLAHFFSPSGCNPCNLSHISSSFAARVTGPAALLFSQTSA